MNDVFIIGNWKLYLDANESVRLAKKLSHTFRFWPVPGVHVAVCPSYPVLAKTYDTIIGSRLELGSQDVGLGNDGPMTGDVSASDLRSIGCDYAIVGHSERRAHGETDAVVRQKLSTSTLAGLIPVLCVGEKTSGKRVGAALRFLTKQLKAAVSGTRPKKLLLAYEPVWAVSSYGKGKPCPPAYAFAVAEGLKKLLERLRLHRAAALLYGGSVDAENILSYVDREHFSGALVGSASTKLEEYVSMVKQIST